MRSESNRNPLLGDEAARYAVYDGIRRDVEAVRGRGNRGHALARSPFRASRRNGDTKPGGITQTRSCDRSRRREPQCIRVVQCCLPRRRHNTRRLYDRISLHFYKLSVSCFGVFLFPTFLAVPRVRETFRLTYRESNLTRIIPRNIDCDS